LFRTVLQKKMSARPSNANAASSRRYYLEDKPSGRMQHRERRLNEEEDDKGSGRFKWDKTHTDCEYHRSSSISSYFAHGRLINKGHEVYNKSACNNLLLTETAVIVLEI
jgi:hypothetical protein